MLQKDLVSLSFAVYNVGIQADHFLPVIEDETKLTRFVTKTMHLKFRMELVYVKGSISYIASFSRCMYNDVTDMINTETADLEQLESNSK